MSAIDDLLRWRDGPPLKVAFVGGGLNSAVGRAHYNAIRLDGLYDLVAGSFSRDAGINEQSARFYGVPPHRAYPDYEALLAAEAGALDAVIVITPTSRHTGPVIAALEAGVPVICEKALASTLEDVEAMRRVERERAGFLAVTYNYTGYPALRELRDLIRSGALGRILHFVAEMPQEGFIRLGPDGRPLRPQDWRLRDGPIPTVYLDLGVHLHQIAHYLLDLAPRRVAAFHRACGHFPVVDFVSASVEYEGEVHGDFYFGKTMLGCRNGLKFRVFGSAAGAEWEQVRPEELRLAHADGRIEILDRGACAARVCNEARYTRFKVGHPAGYIEAFANLYADLRRALGDYRAGRQWRTPEAVGSDLAQHGLRLLEAMARSARERQGVTLDAV